MQYRNSIFAAATLVGSSLAAYIPSEPWTTLTPDESYLSGATTDYTKTFGIAVVTVASSGASSTALAKRDVVSQISDGQIQATTSTASSTKASSTAQVVSQIGDGQIQATTSTATSTKASSTAQVVSQIGDGQIQATTSTASTTSTKATAQVVSQIGDGQIQATTSTASSTKASSTAQVVSQIGDGQIQASTSTSTKASSTAQAISQISDGQIQASTSTSASYTTLLTSTVSNNSTSTSSSTTASSTESSSVEVDSVSCLTDSSLAMTLESSVLTDASGRIGSIVANRQFQFDGPPPQAGAIYAAGWSITEDGYLAIGNNTAFYQCLSGSFYNLYDESIGDQCTEILLEIVDLVSC